MSHLEQIVEGKNKEKSEMEVKMASMSEAFQGQLKRLEDETQVS